LISKAASARPHRGVLAAERPTSEALHQHAQQSVLHLVSVDRLAD
jgi:hypothetical protein